MIIHLYLFITESYNDINLRRHNFWQLKYYTMSDNEDSLFFHVTPTKKKALNEFRLITSPVHLEQSNLYE